MLGASATLFSTEQHTQGNNAAKPGRINTWCKAHQSSYTYPDLALKIGCCEYTGLRASMSGRW